MLEELKRFAAGQLPTVSIGVAYIHDGALEIAESPTRIARGSSGL